VQRALREDYQTTVDIHIGPVADGLPALRSRLASRPDIAIVELGSGDALDGIATWRTNLAAVMDATSDVPCVVFVTVNPVTDYYHSVLDGKLLTIANDWNAALRSAATTRRNMHLVDWAGAVDADRSLVSDGTHPSEQGDAWLAGHLKSATQSC
jgi:hypothetical protein